MTARKKKKPARSRRRSRGKQRTYILERGTLEQMRRARDRTEAYLRYSWDRYSELAHQRDRIEEELLRALNESCMSDFSIKRWQRAVKYQYSLSPLSAEGSTGNIGGRFNMGEEINLNISSFPALYLAIDKDTALQETLGQVEQPSTGLTARELALTNPQSETIVSVSGNIERVIDIRSAKSLRRMARLISQFEVSEHIRKQAMGLGEPVPQVVTTPTSLGKSLLSDDWRIAPQLFDVPSNSQIFGHLVLRAGIEGIVYPSKLTEKDCVALFPRNFRDTTSYIEMDDATPAEATLTRLDESTWRECEGSGP